MLSIHQERFASKTSALRTREARLRERIDGLLHQRSEAYRRIRELEAALREARS